MMTFTVTSANGQAAVHAAGYPAMPSSTQTLALAAPPQAPQQQAAPNPATAGGVGLVVVVALGFLIHRLIDKNKLKWSHAIMCFTMGVLLAGSMLGIMAKQIAGSLGGGLNTMFSTVTTNQGGGGSGSSGGGSGNPDTDFWGANR
ncbi:hypothetical protein ACQP1W_52510 (plasmid) [Spirillospora sp. CA-255316]